MSQIERSELIATLQENPNDQDFWDMVSQEQMNRIIQALEEEWGQAEAYSPFLRRTSHKKCPVENAQSPALIFVQTAN